MDFKPLLTQVVGSVMIPKWKDPVTGEDENGPNTTYAMDDETPFVANSLQLCSILGQLNTCASRMPNQTIPYPVLGLRVTDMPDINAVNSFTLCHVTPIARFRGTETLAAFRHVLGYDPETLVVADYQTSSRNPALVGMPPVGAVFHKNALNEFATTVDGEPKRFQHMCVILVARMSPAQIETVRDAIKKDDAEAKQMADDLRKRMDDHPEDVVSGDGIQDADFTRAATFDGPFTVEAGGEIMSSAQGAAKDDDDDS